MNTDQLLQASSRVAIAGFLHDIGKFAERAQLPIEQKEIDINQQLYCPKREDSGHLFYTHKHAAYTGMAVDILERHAPKLIGEDVYPFGSWKTANVVDSIINAAAAHHKPDTFLQWIIATADRVASGFEREAFEKYNKAGNFSLPTGSRCPNQIRQRRNGVSAQQPILKIMPKRNLVL